MPLPRVSRAWRLTRAAWIIALSATILIPSAACAQLRREMPDALSDREFWQMFTTLSEESGSFPSENFVSNELTYQNVIPSLQRALTPGGVYLGVGPEQNFTYIANLKPRMAVIFDIRRQNAMAHLMYKALFELSPTRAAFVSRLFSRPLPASVGPTTTPTALFAAAAAVTGSDSAFDANWQAIVDQLTVKHGFTLSDTDLRSIRHVYTAFFEAGPDINYGYRLGMMVTVRSTYPTFAQVQTLTNADGVNMAFLATEENYRTLRTLETKNLVVPVVGNFAGPSAIRGVADYLRQHGGTVTAFYLSNVEQYLFRNVDDASRFYGNTQTLPVDATSTFIRSVPPNGFPNGPTFVTTGFLPVASSNNYYSVQVVDSAGVKIITTTSDSAGQRVTSRRIDSTSANVNPLTLFRSLRARDDSLMRANSGVVVVPRDSLLGSGNIRLNFPMGFGSLVSGIASIRESLDAFAKGNLSSYAQAIAMTKTDGWTSKPK